MKKQIKQLMLEAVASLLKKKEAGFALPSEISAEENIPKIEVSHPKEDTFGDYTTNVAMILAGKLKKNPMEIAERINQQLITKNLQQLEKIEIVKPGYINFYLSPEFLQNRIEEINTEKENFGNSDIGKGKKVLVEFISANPTGPIHLGNARGGPLGDALANVLKKSGYQAEKEFYVNDFGNQVLMLGHSILKDDQAQYRGDYVEDLAIDLDVEKKDPMEIGNWGAGIILEKFIKPTCDKSGIKFDNWFSEKSLHTSGKVDEIISTLKEKDLVYEKEGAIWFKSTQFGDDKDRVLVKSNGFKTYLATDFAYHKNKVERGYDKMINIQGADHHKEAGIVKGFVGNILQEKNKIDYILTQIVRVTKDGQEVKMSKRKGTYFALDDLLDETGKDAVRFIFSSYAASSHINFDINLAKERSEKNPVFYVQYAHARICSIIAKAEKTELSSESELSSVGLLQHEKELSLMRELNKFPDLIEEICQNYEVHKLPYYAIGLADKFHSFYAVCRVIDEENAELTKARLNLINAVRIVLAETLRLIGISAPERM